MGLLNAIVTSIAPIFIATSPITSYSDQIWSIHKTRSSAGFSLDIPLIMLASSILKVYYWFGAHFASSLLLQAILMITMHILLLHVALLHRPLSPATHTPFAGYSHGTAEKNPIKALLAGQRPYNFWRWPSPRPYFSFLALLTSTLLTLHLLLRSTALFIPYTNLLGTIALSIEAFLPLPQLYTNWQRRGCRGFRVSVIFNWILGDLFKMWFFFASGSGEGGVPLAFKVCGIFQACCDAGLGIQWWVWGDGPSEDEEMGKTRLGYGLGEKEFELGARRTRGMSTGVEDPVRVPGMNGFLDEKGAVGVDAPVQEWGRA